MKFAKTILICTLFSTILFYACAPKAKDPAPSGSNDPCASKPITLTADITHSIKCKNDGKLLIKARGSKGFTYQIGSASFKTDSTFSNLSPGTYTITIKDSTGCSKAASFTVIETGTKGSNFNAVSNMIQMKCNMVCHTGGVGGAPQGILATDCDIVNRKTLIKTKTDGGMGSLAANEKLLIQTWIDAGGGYTD